jgi:hypothetical protein
MSSIDHVVSGAALSFASGSGARNLPGFRQFGWVGTVLQTASLSASAAMAQQASYTDPGNSGYYATSAAKSVSDDGSAVPVVAGSGNLPINNTGHSFLWTSNGGLAEAASQENPFNASGNGASDSAVAGRLRLQYFACLQASYRCDGLGRGKAASADIDSGTTGSIWFNASACAGVA